MHKHVLIIESMSVSGSRETAPVDNVLLTCTKCDLMFMVSNPQTLDDHNEYQRMTEMDFVHEDDKNKGDPFN